MYNDFENFTVIEYFDGCCIERDNRGFYLNNIYKYNKEDEQDKDE